MKSRRRFTTWNFGGRGGVAHLITTRAQGLRPFFQKCCWISLLDLLLSSQRRHKSKRWVEKQAPSQDGRERHLSQGGEGPDPEIRCWTPGPNLVFFLKNTFFSFSLQKPGENRLGKSWNQKGHCSSDRQIPNPLGRLQALYLFAFSAIIMNSYSIMAGGKVNSAPLRASAHHSSAYSQGGYIQWVQLYVSWILIDTTLARPGYPDVFVLCPGYSLLSNRGGALLLLAQKFLHKNCILHTRNSLKLESCHKGQVLSSIHCLLLWYNSRRHQEVGLTWFMSRGAAKNAVHQWIQGAFWGRAPVPPFFQNHVVFRELQGKPPYFEEILGSGHPLWGQNCTGPPWLKSWIGPWIYPKGCGHESHWQSWCRATNLEEGPIHTSVSVTATFPGIKSSRFWFLSASVLLSGITLPVSNMGKGIGVCTPSIRVDARCEWAWNVAIEDMHGPSV